ncbi:MAG: membrane fusion protein (multidrug efflux system) [Phenylobacterium sp.]|jgi:membrane fusion protein (multidrug efflux system)
MPNSAPNTLPNTQYSTTQTAKSSTKWRRWGLVAVLSLAVTGGLAGFKVLQIKQAIAFGESFPEHSETVVVAQVTHTQWTPQLSVLGEVVVPNTLSLRNELAGKIVEVGFSAGATVSKNQILLRLDTSEEQAQLKAAKAQSKIAQLVLGRVEKLVQQKLASPDEFDKALAEVTIAQAKAEQLQAIINKKTLRAPFAAYADLHQLEAGQFLSANSLITQLVGINATSWVDFKLPQEHATLKAGTRIIAQAPGLLPEPVNAIVVAGDSSVIAQSRHIRFRAELPIATHLLRPGSVINLTVPSGQTQNVAMLPATAIRRDNFGASVYVLEAAEPGADAPFRAAKRQVTLGQPLGENIIITAGLKPGDQVAANGSYKLHQGMLAHIGQQAQNISVAASSQTTGNQL